MSMRRPSTHAAGAKVAKAALEKLAEENEDFLYGRCATLAVAMNELTGWPLYAILGYDEGLDREVLIHAYVKKGDVCIDLKGARSYDEVLEDFLHDDAIGDSYETSITKRDMLILSTGGTRCPSLQVARPLARRILELVRSSGRVRGL